MINGTERLAQLEHTNRGKMFERRPKHCVFDSRNGRIIMEYYNYLFVAYATPKSFVENAVFIRLYWIQPKLANIFTGFLHTTRVGQKFAMRPQFVQNARPQDKSIQLVGTQSVKDKAIRDNILRTVKTPCHICPGIQQP